MSTTRARGQAVVLASAMTACSGSAAVVAGPCPTVSATVANRPARWVTSGASTSVGPEVASGTLVIVNGRRAVVGPDGEVRIEEAPGPEALQGILLVPSAKSGRVLVGHGEFGVYRFAEPLGPPMPLARAASGVRYIGAGPGVVAIWVQGAAGPHFVDVDTGGLRDMPGLSALPMTSVAFSDEKTGAAWFEVAGLAVTRDAMTTWRSVETGRLQDVELFASGRDVRATFWESGGRPPKSQFRSIDAVGATLGATEQRGAPPADDPPMLRWLRQTGLDPLTQALRKGVLAGPDSALVVSDGLLARVDTNTGVITELVDVDPSRAATECSIARAGASAFVACNLPAVAGSDDIAGRTTVMRVRTTGSLSVQQEVMIGRRVGALGLRAAPSGGVMLPLRCFDASPACAWIRQPDGRWASGGVRSASAGPMADGRVAFLRGVDSAEPEWPPLLVLVTPSGIERRLDIAWPSGIFRPGATVRTLSSVEEDDAQRLHFLLSLDDTLLAVTQPLSGAAASVRRIKGIRHASMSAGRAIAVSDGRLDISIDWGEHWERIDPPAAIADLVESLNLFEVGAMDVGALVRGQSKEIRNYEFLRIGWGPEADAAALRPEPSEMLELPRSPDDDASRGRFGLTCRSSSGAASRVAVPWTHEERVELLASPGAPPQGTRRERSYPLNAEPLGAHSLLEEEGPSTEGSAPTQWTLRYYDPMEAGARVRSVSGAAPKGVAWGSKLRSAAAHGDQAVFSVRAGNQEILARAGGGKVEIAEVLDELAPTSRIAIGSGPNESSAWTSGGTLVAWPAGEPPRALVASHYFLRHPPDLGQPTAEGVPMAVFGMDFGVMRFLPVPPSVEGGSRAPSAAPAPGLPPIAGWTSKAGVGQYEGDPPPFGGCGPTSKGARFSASGRNATATVNGIAWRVLDAAFVYEAGPEPCVARVVMVGEAEMSPVPQGVAEIPPAKRGTPMTVPHPMFIRADLAAQRAEGGEVGLGRKVSRMTCEVMAQRRSVTTSSP